MKTYIRSAANISPQKTFNELQFLNELVEYQSNRLTCIEPDYNTIIDAKLGRRMSRIIKMSVAAALTSLKDAGISNPDAIVTGTAYGCLEDTGTFLHSMVEHDEEPITPTAFVQSTHNTIGAQIALLLKCRGYNNTFVNNGASFENALLDAMTLLAERENTNILVGGIDEITNASHAILSRMGLFKRKPVSNLDLFEINSKGTINGEGSAFFVVGDKPSGTDLACLEGLATFYKPNGVQEIIEHINQFLAAQSIDIETIGLLILGKSGDKKGDEIYTAVQQTVFAETPSINYKHLCGEYPTSTAFALWLAANIISIGNIPTAFGLTEAPKKILIYNHYQNVCHSLILVSSC